MIEKNSLSLRPMTDEEWPEWSAGSREEYTLEKMRAEGLTRAEAEKVADDSFASLLPEGIRSPDQFLFGIWDATARLRVGWLWYCLRGEASASARGSTTSSSSRAFGIAASAAKRSNSSKIGYFRTESEISGFTFLGTMRALGRFTKNSDFRSPMS